MVGRTRGAVLLSLVIVVSMLSFVVESTHQAAASSPSGTAWTGVPDINGGFPVHSISCTSFSFCAAVGGWSYGGADATVFDGHSWTAPQELGALDGLASVSCASTTYCVAVGSGGAYVYDGAVWSPLPTIAGLDGFLSSVSCVSDSFCVAIGNFEGSPDSSTAYVLDGTSWTQSDLLSASVNYPAVSCYSANFCAAVGTGGAVLWNGVAWTDEPPTLPTFDALLVVSCPSASSCVAIDSNGAAWTINGSVWTSQPVFSDSSPTSVSCSSSTSCVAASAEGQIATYGGTAWTLVISPTDPPVGDSESPDLAVSCSDQTFCAAVDEAGDVFYDNYGSWTNAASQTIDNTSVTSSCVSSTFCMGVDFNGQYLTYNGTSWSVPAPTITNEISLQSVSCVSSADCVAADYAGATLRWNGTNWSAFGGLTNGYPGRVSCTSSTFCVEVAGKDASVFNGAGWGVAQPISPSLFLNAISCASPQFCAAFDEGGNAYTYNGISWSEEPAVVGGTNSVSSISCPSVGFCTAVDGAGDEITYQNDQWVVDGAANLVHGYITGLSSISCTSAEFCVGVGYQGSSVTFDGSTWAPGQTVGETSGDVSCPSTIFCVAIDQTGAVHYLYVDTTTVRASSNESTIVLGQPVLLAASVSAPATEQLGVPIRDVTFAVGSSVLCTSVLSGGEAHCQAETEETGRHPITVTYSGDDDYLGSKTTIPLDVLKAQTSVSLTFRSPVRPSKEAASPFKVKVSGSVAEVPTGTVKIDAISTKGKTALVCSVVLNQSGNGTCEPTSKLKSGNYSVVAKYSGDTNFKSADSVTSPLVVS